MAAKKTPEQIKKQRGNMETCHEFLKKNVNICILAMAGGCGSGPMIRDSSLGRYMKPAAFERKSAGYGGGAVGKHEVRHQNRLRTWCKFARGFDT